MSSNAFFHSTHFIDGDGFKRSTLGLLLVVLLLLAWLAWFFLGQITLYETSRSAEIASAETAVATFTPSALATLQTGQAAQLRLHDFPWTEYGSVETAVSDITFQENDPNVTVTFHFNSGSNSRLPIRRGLAGEVLVAVDTISPAELVLRTISHRLAGTAAEETSTS